MFWCYTCLNHIDGPGSQHCPCVCILPKTLGNHLSSDTFLRGRPPEKVVCVSPSNQRMTNMPAPNRPLDLAKVAELKSVMPISMSMPTDPPPERSSPISSNSRTYHAMSYAYTPKRSLNSSEPDVGAQTFPYRLRPSFPAWKKKSTF